ncbi:uncharacterized protein V6R79_019314 [Siganus canaliculatus]
MKVLLDTDVKRQNYKASPRLTFQCVFYVVPPQRGFHLSGNRPGLVTHRGDDGLTAHLRERPGPSGELSEEWLRSTSDSPFTTPFGSPFDCLPQDDEEIEKCASARRQKPKRLCVLISGCKVVHDGTAALRL